MLVRKNINFSGTNQDDGAYQDAYDNKFLNIGKDILKGAVSSAVGTLIPGSDIFVNNLLNKDTSTTPTKQTKMTMEGFAKPFNVTRESPVNEYTEEDYKRYYDRVVNNNPLIIGIGNTVDVARSAKRLRDNGYEVPEQRDPYKEFYDAFTSVFRK